MKISIVGAGNVGSLSAMRIAQENLGEVFLIDVVKGLAQGKAFDMEDARSILKINYNIQGADDVEQLRDSDIIVITAGLARKPGMSREELVNKNSQIVKEVCLNIKRLASKAVVIVVTNPLDLMTYLALKTTGFKPSKVFGMGITLDAARFANIIGKELNASSADIEACVIGSHGEGMLPLPRLSRIKGAALDKAIGNDKARGLAERTVKRGAEIVSLLGSGSAFFAPSAAISEIVKAVAKNEKRALGVCAYLNGEYAVNDICIGVPCVIGKDGIEKIIELELNKDEKELFLKSAESVRSLIKTLA